MAQSVVRQRPRLPRPVPPPIADPLSEDERWVVLHLRGHLHFAPACRMCKLDTAWAEERTARERAERSLEGVISGEPVNARLRDLIGG